MKFLKFVFAFLLIHSNIFAQKSLNTVVYFDKNSSVLTIESQKLLSEWVSKYKHAKSKSLSVFLEGHTDTEGNDKNNLALSKKRVAQVQSHLLQQGVATKIKFSGENSPINTNSTEAEKQLNRRVEIRVLNEKLTSFFQNLDLEAVDKASIKQKREWGKKSL
jgi:OmpA-OmpF porin, OOP family